MMTRTSDRRWLVTLGLAGALFATPAATSAQQAERDGSFGLRVGVTTYYGELNDRIFPARPELRGDLGDILGYATWGLDYESYFGNGFGISLGYANAEFTASDRGIDWSGELQRGEPNFRRALNVRTKLNELSLLLTWSANDGRVLPEDAWLAPFARLGVAGARFTAYGDLYRAGLPYVYAEDGQILQGGGSDILVPSELDGDYETRLRALQTNDESYSQYLLAPLAGLGLNFRLGDRNSLQLATTVRFPFTDFLDDVGGAYVTGLAPIERRYASNPAGTTGTPRSEAGNDVYAVTDLTYRLYFGNRGRDFRAPQVILGELPLGDTSAATATLFRFEAPEPLPKREFDGLGQPRAVLLRSQQVLSVPRPAARPSAPDAPRWVDDGGEEVPSIEDEQAVDFDTNFRAPYYVDGAASEQPATAPTDVAADSEGPGRAVPRVVTGYPRWSQHERFGLSDSLRRQLNSVATLRLPVVDTVAVRQRADSLASVLAETDSRMVVLAAEMDSLRRELARDTVTVARRDTLVRLDTTVVAGQQRIDRVILRDTVIYEQFVRGTSARSKRDERAARRSVELEAEIDALRTRRTGEQRALEVFEAQRRELEREREQLARERRQALRDEQRRLGAQTRVPPITTVATTPPAFTPNVAPDTALIAVLQADQAALREQVEALRAELALLRAERTAQPSAAEVVPVPTVAVGSDDTRLLLSELRALREEVASLRTPPSALSPAPPPPPVAVPVVNPSAQFAATLQGYGVRRVFFATGSASLDAAARAVVRETAELAARYPGRISVRLEGFTDPTGNADANRRLSERRVAAVRDALAAAGVPAGAVTLAGLGEDADAPDLAYGRRVELRVSGR